MKHDYSDALEIIKINNLLTDNLTVILLYSELFDIILKKNGSVVNTVFEMTDTLRNTMEYIKNNKMNNVLSEKFMNIFCTLLLKSNLNNEKLKDDIILFSKNYDKYISKYNYINLLKMSNYSEEDKVNIMITFNNFKKEIFSRINNTFKLDIFLDEKLLYFINNKKTNIGYYLRLETSRFLKNKMNLKELTSDNFINNSKMINKLSETEKVIYLTRKINELLGVTEDENVNMSKMKYITGKFSLFLRSKLSKDQPSISTNTYSY